MYYARKSIEYSKNKNPFARKISGRVVDVGNELDNLKRFLLAICFVAGSRRAECSFPVLNQF